jgi:hypothetical protein
MCAAITAYACLLRELSTVMICTLLIVDQTNKQLANCLLYTKFLKCNLTPQLPLQKPLYKLADRQTDRHNEAKSRFSKFDESA